MLFRSHLEGTKPGDQMGRQVAGVGDVDGDAFDDLILAASNNEVFAFYGRPNGLGAEPDWTARVGSPDSEAGVTVAAAGDVDKDGHDDPATSDTAEDITLRPQSDTKAGPPAEKSTPSP